MNGERTPGPFYREITSRDGILIWQDSPQRIVCTIQYPRDDMNIAGADPLAESQRVLDALNAYDRDRETIRELATALRHLAATVAAEAHGYNMEQRIATARDLLARLDAGQL